MTKVVVTTLTEITFDSIEDFYSYINSDEQARITGFADEIKQAWENNERLTVKTERPSVGAVAKSYISALKIK